MKMWPTLKRNNYFLFELFIFFRSISFSISSIAQSLLIQDKICLLNYRQNESFCDNIQRAQTVEVDVKDHILAEVAQFNTYIFILQCIPMFIWSMFIGSFLDNWSGSAMLLLNLHVLDNVAKIVISLINVQFYDSSPTFLLLTASTYWFTGGFTCNTAAQYKYIATHSEQSVRSLKFMFAEVSGALGFSLGTFVGGQILSNTKADNSTTIKPMRTYDCNFIANLCLSLVAFILLFLVYKFDRRKDTSGTDINQNEVEYLFDENNNDNDNESAPNASIPIKLSNTNIMKTLFNCDNIKQTFACLTKKRERQTRLHLHTFLTILFVQIFAIFGIENVFFPFVEKVYHWDSVEFTIYSSLANVSSILLMTISTTLLVKVFSFGDGQLLLIAHMSSFISNVTRGTFLTPLAFFIAVPIGSLSGFTFISTRSKLSKLVPEEVGKIFSVIALMEALLPIVASSIYSNIFALSIGVYPGMVYQLSAAILVFSLVIAVFEQLYFD